MWFDEFRELLGSKLRITFEHADREVGERFLEQSWKKLEHFHSKYSRFIEGNSLYKMNAHFGEWQKIDEETYEHFKTVKDYQRKFPLNFSLAVKKPLEDLGYDSKYSFQPKSGLEEKAVRGEVLLKEPDQLFISDPVEFGGFGKGYALDAVAGILRNECGNICLDFGGDLYAKGKNETGEPWKMALESPLNAEEAIGTLVIDDQFSAASGTLRRRWGKNLEYHHLIDPQKSKSANYWAGSYVLANSGMEADYLATSLFCSPLQQIEALAPALSQSKFLLISPTGKIFNHNFPAQLFSK